MKKSLRAWITSAPALRPVHNAYVYFYWPIHRFLQFCARKSVHIPKKSRSSLNDFRVLVSLMSQNFRTFPLIRIGASGDGGYPIPDDLAGVQALFSPGVGVNADFEKGFISRGIPCYLADASVDRPPISNALVHFEKKFVGAPTNDPRFVTLGEWISGVLPHSTDLVLQMDIEGSEWEVFDFEANATLSKFRFMVIEFHNLHNLFNKNELELANRILKKIFEDFYIVNIHPNNGDLPVKKYGVMVPPLLEVTFLRKDRLVNPSPPHVPYQDVNARNDTRYKDVTLKNLKSKNKNLFSDFV